jgi:nicotinamidase/pyrazinamidase
MAITIQPTDAFIIVDVQNDFCPPHDGIGGALAIPDGDAVIAPINALAPRFAHVIVTLDWHPPRHISFASTHRGAKVHDVLRLCDGVEQMLWPDHCLQETPGAALHPGLRIPPGELTIHKGIHREIDSYSAFLENDGTTSTGLADHLHAEGIRRVFLAGLAYDFCVHFSARDARRAGFEVFVVEDACRAVDINNSVAETNAHFAAEKITRIQASEIL